jgi:hypothetical protein
MSVIDFLSANMLDIILAVQLYTLYRIIRLG